MICRSCSAACIHTRLKLLLHHQLQLWLPPLLESLQATHWGPLLLLLHSCACHG